jgi:hypothetical protein
VLFYQSGGQDRYHQAESGQKILCLSCAAFLSSRTNWRAPGKFFADPPAALVVLKGLRKLAERKVLLGRAPVQSSRSATGEAGIKNGEIEANGEKTQTAEPQEDKAYDPIVGGEKRSQMREQQFPAGDFRPENTLGLISHFANSSRIMLP